jgi:hypothetical protein
LLASARNADANGDTPFVQAIHQLDKYPLGPSSGQAIDYMKRLDVRWQVTVVLPKPLFTILSHLKDARTTSFFHQSPRSSERSIPFEWKQQQSKTHAHSSHEITHFSQFIGVQSLREFTCSKLESHRCGGLPSEL